MITSNEVYNDLISLENKVNFLRKPSNTNEQVAAFWVIVGNKLKDIIEYIEKDKRMYRW